MRFKGLLRGREKGTCICGLKRHLSMARRGSMMRWRKKVWPAAVYLTVLLLSFSAGLKLCLSGGREGYFWKTGVGNTEESSPEGSNIIKEKSNANRQISSRFYSSAPPSRDTALKYKAPKEKRKGRHQSTELTCEELQNLLEKVKSIEDSILRQENDIGNRGIYYATLQEKHTNVSVDVVIKVASLLETNIQYEAHRYGYNSAVKEIKALQRLQTMNWKGVPTIYGACITPSEVLYAVQRIHGSSLCKGLGIDMRCVTATDLKNIISHSPDPGLSTLKFLSQITCFFQQFEKDKVFMEDLSGSNLYIEDETLDVFLVDADSLIFYGSNPIYSQSSCKEDRGCAIPPGNFWVHGSLNKKVYSACDELSGSCVNYVCRGIDASLHVCGIGRWLISPLRTTVPEKSHDAYRELLLCMMASAPDDRCTFEAACSKFTAEYLTLKEDRLDQQRK